LEAATGLCDTQPNHRLDIVMTSYTIRSPLAMCASAISGSLSILLLVEPALKEGFTIDTMIPAAMAVGLVIVTIITGILAHGAGPSVAGCALAALSIACSAVIVLEQTGRRAHTRNQTAVVVVDTTAERARLTQLRAEADQILTCDGISYTVRTWEAAREGYDAKLRGLPVLSPDAKGEFAGTLAGLLGRDAKMARAWVMLLDPLAFPFVLELCSIICGVFAWGPKVSAHLPLSGNSKTDISESGNVQQTQHVVSEMSATSNVTPIRAGNVVNVSDDETIVVGLRRLGGTAQSQRDLARVMGISPAEVSKRLSASPSVLRVREDNRMVVKLKR
jgi:hypothetical protein